MRRRDLIVGMASSAFACPLAARAQPSHRLWHVGFIAGGSRPVPLEPSAYGGFLRGMRELGWTERQDFIVEWRFAEGRYELFSEFAAELVRLNVDVIVTATPTAIAPAAQATRTIPIVMATSTDPVGSGYVASLARPGGNITGLASSQDDILAKQLELLAMCVPDLNRLGVLVNPDSSFHPLILKIISDVAQKTGVTVVRAEMGRPDDLDGAFATLTKEHVSAVLFPGDGLFFSQRARLTTAAREDRLPTMANAREFVEVGGFLSYGEGVAELYRHAAFYVDRILKGEKPADLPVQQPTKFYTTINRTTAKILGLTIPLQLLVLSDEVIE
jgi:putative ABC transport system substrate-binding protein